MKQIVFATAMALVVATGPAHAAPKPAAADVLMAAEHAQWRVDHDRWHAEHLALAGRLEAMAAALRAPDSSFAEHARELDTHKATLSGDADVSARAAAHARLASSHEEARLRHHEVVDDVAHLETLFRDDRDGEANEASSPR